MERKEFKSLVDFGSGSGWMALKLSSLYRGKVTAVDFSADAMQHLVSLNGNLDLSSLEDFFGSQCKFDFLTCIDTFEHLNDPLEMMRKIYEKAERDASYLFQYRILILTFLGLILVAIHTMHIHRISTIIQKRAYDI